MELGNKKKPTILNSNNVGVGEDKISNLPDALIHHILSFLPTKCGMSTCILSKRWKCVSNSIPTLDFRGCEAVSRSVKEKHLKTQQFMDFLDTVLYLHEKPNIQKFYLSWDQFFNHSRVNKWISIVIKRKVEELFLSVPSETYYFIFPLSLFTCDSLTVLELDLDGLRLNVPTMVSFPRLKLLRLRRMKFVNGIIEKLISNCPILEELSLRDCRGLESEVLCIANLALKNLYISHCHFRESTVKICSPNLSTISYGYLAPADFVIDSFSSLVEADIGITFFKNDGSEKSMLIELLKKLASVKLLKISGESFLVLSEADMLLNNLPAFNNLIHLEVSSRFDCTSSGSVSSSKVRILFRFLQLSPNLESIVFAQSIYFLDGENYDCWSLDPKCSLPHLKSIKFMHLNGGPMELNVIKFFLKYGRFLETVTIVASPLLSKDHKEQRNVMKLLEMFPKPTDCVIKFSACPEKALQYF